MARNVYAPFWRLFLTTKLWLKIMDCYLDAEFTSHEDPRLISIGLVCDDGRTFYGEVSDVDLTGCSDFVVAHVLPLLNRAAGARMSRQVLAETLGAWLRDVRPKHVVSDFEGDWRLLHALMEGGGAACLEALDAVKKKIIPPEAVRGAEFRLAVRSAYDSLPDKGRTRHHALTDARALAVVCKSMKKASSRPMMTGASSKARKSKAECD